MRHPITFFGLSEFSHLPLFGAASVCQYKRRGVFCRLSVPKVIAMPNVAGCEEKWKQQLVRWATCYTYSHAHTRHTVYVHVCSKLRVEQISPCVCCANFEILSLRRAHLTPRRKWNRLCKETSLLYHLANCARRNDVFYSQPDVISGSKWIPARTSLSRVATFFAFLAVHFSDWKGHCNLQTFQQQIFYFSALLLLAFCVRTLRCCKMF